jgi:hypothetical protein
MQDLEEAITYLRDTLALHPPGHHHRPLSLDNLATAIQTRFEQMRQMPDLEESFCLLESAVDHQFSN